MEKLSPFELKDKLIAAAKKPTLNAGRGNPNFYNSFVREAFAELQLIVLRMPKAHVATDLDIYAGPGDRDWAADLPARATVGLPERATFGLRRGLAEVRSAKVKRFLTQYLSSFTNEKELYDVVLSTLGTFYPSPPRIQPHLQKICAKYTKRAFKTGATEFEFFACEGAAAGILYVFNTLFNNNLMRQGERIAIITPIFSPYLEIPKLHPYDMKIVELAGDPANMYALSESEMDKLKDPAIKVLFLVNPANPSEFSLPRSNIKYIADIIRQHNRDLIIITDTVYAPFVSRFDSFIQEIPENTVLIQSLSKYFGVTGWRLGFVAVPVKTRLNAMIRDTRELRKRYGLISLKPAKLTFMERLVTDSRQVAEGHVAGLSTPLQVLMGMFLFYDMKTPQYKKSVRALLLERIKLLYSSIGVKPTITASATNYYTLLNVPAIAETLYGPAARERVEKQTYLKFLFHLAKQYGVVLLPGAGFGADEWAVRVSLANLDTASYKVIGDAIKGTIAHFGKVHRPALRAGRPP